MQVADHAREKLRSEHASWRCHVVSEIIDLHGHKVRIQRRQTTEHFTPGSVVPICTNVKRAGVSSKQGFVSVQPEESLGQWPGLKQATRMKVGRYSHGKTPRHFVSGAVPTSEKLKNSLSLKGVRGSSGGG